MNGIVIFFSKNIGEWAKRTSATRLLINKIKWLLHRLKSKDSYITEKKRPIHAKSIKCFFNDSTDDVAILIRGPVINKNNFTIETIKIYRSYYPNANIYLSTWDYCLEGIEDIIKTLEIKLISSKFINPKKGIGSTNLQIKGNLQALEYIEKDNIKYTLSTRTDQRFYSSNILKSLKLIQKEFGPYNKFSENDRQVERMIGISFNTFLYRLYGLSDMFLFGLTEDVKNYWNSKEDDRNPSNKSYDSDKSMRDYSKLQVNEVYFMCEFLKRNGQIPKWSLNDYWEILKNRFIIIDSSSLDFIWPKYTFIEDRWKDYTKELHFKEITYLDWLLIKENQLKINENLLDLSIKNHKSF